MNKNQLMTALREKGVAFDKKAKVEKLRKIYDETIVSEASNEQNDDDVIADDESEKQRSEQVAAAAAKANATTIPNNSDSVANKESIQQTVIPINSDANTKVAEKSSDPNKENDDWLDEDTQRRLDALVLHTPTAMELKLQQLREEEAFIDAQLRVQAKKQHLLDLQLKEANNLELLTPIAKHIFKPQYKDVKHLIQMFSGSDEFDANKWVKDFERACDSINADEHTRLVFFRQSMKADSVAELFLRTDSSQTYSDIKKNFLANFHHRFSVGDILDKLRRTTFRTTKLTVIGYILKMQTIAAQSTIDEPQLIQSIIEGFEDQSPHIAVLYPAKTIQELKDLAHRYAQLRDHSAPIPSTFSQRQTFRPNSSNSVRSANQTSSVKPASSAPPQCFNCSGEGHIARDCPAPKRVKGSCFRCGDTKHIVKNCPLPPPPRTENRVALIGDANQDGDANDDSIGTTNEVSVTFLQKCSEISSKNLLSLFDSGSPVSLIKRSMVPGELNVRTSAQKSKYYGIGNEKICTYGIILIKIKFRNKMKQIQVFVVPDYLLSHSMLLGRDFLRGFGIRFTMDDSIENNSNISLDSESLNLVISEHILHFVGGSVCELCKPIFCSEIEVNEKKSEDFRVADDHGGHDDHLTFCSENSVHSETNIDNTFSALCAIEIDSRASISETYDINSNLIPEHRKEIQQIIQCNYLNYENIPKIEHDYCMRIRLTSEDPISFSPRRLSYADKQIVNETIDDLLEKGIIRPSNSPFAFGIVPVPKKDNTKRVCVDYRPLNKRMIRDRFPLPNIDDCLERLEGMKYFSSLDLKTGFHQIRMAEDSIQYTAFVTPNGQYEYLFMPFGLANGPSVFQRFVNFVLADFIREGSVIVFSDDITLATKTLLEHFELVKRVLYRLAEYRLVLNPSKCKFCYTELDVLGFTVNSKGTRPNHRHLEAIKRMVPPRNAEHTNKILGLFSFFRRYIKSYSTISAPIRELTKPNVPFRWTDECQRIFEDLKNQLITAPVLALYSPTRETELHCDASAKGFGGILLQRQDDGKIHPIAYFSKSTSASESMLHSYELETLAVVYSVDRFRHYLEGIKFRIITDCEALVQTLNRQKTTPKIARWALSLDKFEFTIKHRSGSLMSHVDTLSRYPIAQMEVDQNDNNPNEQIALIDPTDVDIQLQIMQNRDENIVQLRQKLENGNVTNFMLDDGLVYYQKPGEKALLYVPKEMEQNIIRQAHDKTCHMGVDKCLDQIKLHYWFPKIREKLEHFIKNCIQCVIHSVPPHCSFRTLHNIPKKPIPFDTIHIDHFGPLPSLISKKKHILVVIDAFTKHTKLYAVKSTDTREVAVCLETFFEYYSRPRRIISDRGSAFRSEEFNTYLDEQNIEHVKIATSSPQANGQVERVNRTLKAMLSKTTESIQHSDWSKMLRKVEFAMNNSIQSSTKQTPCMLLYGVAQRGREVDVLTEYLDDKDESQGVLNLEEIRKTASENVAKSQERNLNWHLAHKKPHVQFEVGNYVMIRNVDTTIGTNKKFIPKFRGPYIIHKKLPNDRYVIRDIENCQVTQIPYDGIIEASRIRRFIDWRDSHEDALTEK